METITAWEQRKFIDIAPLQRGFDLPISEMKAGPYPVVMSNGIGAYHYKYKVKSPGVVTGRSGTIGNLTFVESDYWPHNTALWVTDFKGNDAKFIYYLYNKLDLKRYGTGSGVPTLNRNDVHDASASIPSAEEQRQISRLFTNLDNLITLHQRKLDRLKQLKQGYLQQMFPRDGESVPRLRFANFHGKWEQRKLGEVAKFNPKAILPDKFEYVDLESVIGTSLISRKTETKESAPSRAQRLAKQGDVFYQTVRPYQKNNYLFNLPYNNYVFSTGYTQMRPYVDSYFLLSRLQEERFVKNVLDRSTGTSYPAISSTDLADIEIKVPVIKKEQRQIGLLFKNLDYLITLHQTKSDRLKSLKKAYLQKMFT